MTSFRYNGVYQTERIFYMEYKIKYYYRVKYTLICAKTVFSKSRLSQGHRFFVFGCSPSRLDKPPVFLLY